MKISAAESRVMDVLWRVGRPIASEEVAEILANDLEWSHGTVRTLLTRLVHKKAVATAKEGRRFLYRPLVARADYVHAESRGLVDRLFGGQLTPLVHHFSEQGELTPEDLARLKALIADIEKKHG